MILFQIPKLEFVFNVSKFGFRNSQSKQNTHIGFLKNPKKNKKMPIQTRPNFDLIPVRICVLLPN
jgi:hypothetical protein